MTAVSPDLLRSVLSPHVWSAPRNAPGALEKKGLAWQPGALVVRVAPVPGTLSGLPPGPGTEWALVHVLCVRQCRLRLLLGCRVGGRVNREVSPCSLAAVRKSVENVEQLASSLSFNSDMDGDMPG